MIIILPLATAISLMDFFDFLLMDIVTGYNSLNVARIEQKTQHVKVQCQEENNWYIFMVDLKAWSCKGGGGQEEVVWEACKQGVNNVQKNACGKRGGGGGLGLAWGNAREGCVCWW